MGHIWTTILPHLQEMLKDLIIPVILLVIGGVGKSLARAKHEDEDWFLGPDLILAGMATMFTSAIDAFAVFLRFRGVIHSSARPTVEQMERAGMVLGNTVGYAIVALVLYFVILRTAQALKLNSYSRGTKICWLGLAGNFIGVTAMAVTIFLIQQD